MRKWHKMHTLGDRRMSNEVDYLTAPATWRTITTTKKDGSTTDQWQATLRYTVTVIDKDGTERSVKRRKTKLFPASVDTDRKKSSALKAWRKQLAQEQAERMERERIAEEERLAAERAARDDLGLTVCELVDKYIEARKVSSYKGREAIAGSTVADYRATLRRLEPDFSTVPAKTMKAIAAQDWEDQQVREGIHPLVVGKCHRLLKAAYRWGMRKELVDSNPMELVDPPSRPKKKPESLDQRTMQRLTSILMESNPTPLVVAAMLALHCGLRQGECCGLTWGDVDLDARTLRVVRTVAVGEHEGMKSTTFIKEPKSAESHRTLFIDNELAVVLGKRRDAMLRQARKAEVLDSDFSFEGLYVIGNIAGDYIAPLRIGKSWREFAEEHGITSASGKRLTFHGLRHSYVTAGISAGADVKSVAANAGHSSTQMTVDVYAGALPQAQRIAAEQTAAYMRPPTGIKAQADVLTLDPTGTAGV